MPKKPTSNQEPKTSRSHPIRIDSVTVPGGGRIGMTFCPGKKQVHSISGPWDRDLETDLRVIVDWGAKVLVTSLEEHEFEELAVHDLGDRAESLGLEWHYLPIWDGCVPDHQFESDWVYAGHRLRELLRNGQDIVIHCKGGLGRTGTIAARLLIEFGLNPDEAIKEVRASRPGAIETSSQEQYVRQCVPV